MVRAAAVQLTAPGGSTAWMPAARMGLSWFQSDEVEVQVLMARYHADVVLARLTPAR